MVSRSDDELTKKIFYAQKVYLIKGDWVTFVMNDLKTVNINLDEDKIGKTNNYVFMKFVRKMSKMKLSLN